MPPPEAILIPGGGVRAEGELPEWTLRRLQRALQVEGSPLFILLSAGTPHKPPPLDGRGFPIFESIAAARWLLAHGIPAERILTETCSYDTIGNAYFARRLHVDPLGLRRLLVITSAFHLARTTAVFEWVFSLDAPPGGYHLQFEAVSDAGIDPRLLSARQEKEAAALRQVQRLRAEIHSLTVLHRWLYTQHAAYVPAAPPSATPDEDARASY